MQQQDKTVFEVEGKQYTLVVDVDAMIALEDMFSTPQKEMTFSEVYARVQAGSVKYGRAFVWAAMQRHHPNTTLKQAGDLLVAPAFVKALFKLAGMATPDPQDTEALGVKPEQTVNPRKAQTGKKGGTGGRLNSSPVALA